MNARALRAVVVIVIGAITAGCSSAPADLARRSPGDAERGRALILQNGCVSCHAIPGVPSVEGDLNAPDLHGFAERNFIAGQIPNRTEELIQWLLNPQAIAPGTLMPDVGLTRSEAEDIAAYLYQH